MAKCEHPTYTVTHALEYVEMGPRGRHLVLKLRVFCPTCKRPYEINAPFGFSLREPTLDAEGDLTIPVTMPAQEELEVEEDPQVNQISDSKIVH